jgi:hypothetical protein
MGISRNLLAALQNVHQQCDFSSEYCRAPLDIAKI